jgi:hypothetical protein
MSCGPQEREYQNDSPSALKSLVFLDFKQSNTSFKNLLDWSNHITIRGMTTDADKSQKKPSRSVLPWLAYGSPLIAVTLAGLFWASQSLNGNGLTRALSLLTLAALTGVCSGIAGLIGVAISQLEDKVLDSAGSHPRYCP